MTTELTQAELCALSTEEAEREELERKIELLEMARINLRVSPVIFERLNKVAEFNHQSIEDYCISLLEESLKELIGKPTITGPSSLSNSTTSRVMGPSSISTVTRVTSNGY